MSTYFAGQWYEWLFPGQHAVKGSRIYCLILSGYGQTYILKCFTFAEGISLFQVYKPS